MLRNYLVLRFLMTSLIVTVVYPGDPAQPATGALAEEKLAENLQLNFTEIYINHFL